MLGLKLIHVSKGGPDMMVATGMSARDGQSMRDVKVSEQTELVHYTAGNYHIVLLCALEIRPNIHT